MKSAKYFRSLHFGIAAKSELQQGSSSLVSTSSHSSGKS